MTALRFVRGQRLIYRGTEFVVDGRFPDGRCMLRTPCNTDAAILGEDDIRTSLGSGELRLVRCQETVGSARGRLLQVDFSGLPERYKAQAERKYAYLKAFAEKPVRAYTKQALAPLIAEVAEAVDDPSPPSWITAYRWHRLFEAAGRDIRALVPAFAYRGSSDPRLPDDVLNIAERCVEKFWCGKNRTSAASVHRAIVDEIIEANKRRMTSDPLPIVSQKYVYRLIDRLDLYTRERARQGPRSAKLKFAPKHAVPDPVRPNAIVEIDHTVVNVFVIDDETGFPLGRPWLTVALDRATRMIVGFHIGFDPPSYDVVAACLHNAILPKDYVRNDYPLVEGAWEAWGQIERILVDRALEFRSEPLKDSCKVLDIAIDWTPRRQPWYKGKVERFMRTIGDDLFHRLPGAARPLAQRWDEEQPWKNARITLAGLRLLAHLWIIDYYSQKPHSGIGNKTPAARWAELTSTYPVTPFYSRDDLDTLLGAPQRRGNFKQGHSTGRATLSERFHHGPLDPAELAQAGEAQVDRKHRADPRPGPLGRTLPSGSYRQGVRRLRQGPHLASA